MQRTPEGFIVVDLTEDMYATAEAKAKEMGTLKNSIRNGKGNLCGFLGEEAVLKAFPGAQSANTYQHDITYDGLTLEIKTKDRTVPPLLEYDASIANYNSTQNADLYVFVSLLRDKATNKYTKAYIAGTMTKVDYKAEAHFYRVGDVDPSNGWRVSADCYNVPYAKLTRFGEE